MDYQNESDLLADGFALTTNIFQTGAGKGKVYEKIVHQLDEAPKRIYFSVDTEGVVAPWNFVVPAPTAEVKTEDVTPEVAEDTSKTVDTTETTDEVKTDDSVTDKPTQNDTEA